jgi:transposase
MVEVGAMSLARLVVTAVRVEERSKSEVARDYRISRRWVHELVKRFDAEGEAGLAPRSRRPHTSHNALQTRSSGKLPSCAKS